jgi:hypothetical protein
MSTLSLSPKISGLLAGFALFATCLLSSGCAEFQGNRATNADDWHPRYPSVVVAVGSEDRGLDWDIVRQSDSPFWQDVMTLERKAQIWRIQVYKHADGEPIGEFMDWTDITTRKVRLNQIPLEKLLRVEMDFCTTKDPNEANADCQGRQINILLHKYPD